MQGEHPKIKVVLGDATAWVELVDDSNPSSVRVRLDNGKVIKRHRQKHIVDWGDARPEEKCTQ
jgi:hypothetical protein